MAIGTPTTLGTTANATGSSMTHSTSANAPAGSKCILCATGIAASGTAPTISVSGGPGGWTKRKEVNSASLSSGFGGVATIFDVDLASQMNSATTLTFTASTAMFGLGMAAFYVTGLGAADTATDGRAKTTASTTFDTQATTAPNTTVADALTVACAIIDSTSSITITAPPLELHDFTNTNAWTHITAYEIKAATGAARIQGTWANSAPDISALASYQGAGGAAASPVFIPHRMPLGV